jgi:RNA methyltransferase, TrmH family
VKLDITSAVNPHVRELAGLRQRRRRHLAGRFLIEGARELGRAIEGGVSIEEVLYAPTLASPTARALADSLDGVTRLGDAAFAKLTVRQHPDGIIGVAATWRPELTAIDRDLVLIAERIEKPGNLGAMLRTADGAGAAVAVADPTVDLFNPNVVRASQGSLFTVPVAVADASAVAEWAAERGRVVVAGVEATEPLWDADLSMPVAIVIGSEHDGVSDHWRRLGTAVRIPMAGPADSLNASVAAAIVLYEAVRQSRVDGRES